MSSKKNLTSSNSKTRISEPEQISLRPQNKIISKSSIPQNIHQSSFKPQSDNIENFDKNNLQEGANTDYMKETAQKVVELQRTVMKLRSRLKQKESVEEESNKLLEEMQDWKAKYIESQRKVTS